MFAICDEHKRKDVQIRPKQGENYIYIRADIIKYIYFSAWWSFLYKLSFAGTLINYAV